MSSGPGPVNTEKPEFAPFPGLGSLTSVSDLRESSRHYSGEDFDSSEGVCRRSLGPGKISGSHGTDDHASQLTLLRATCFLIAFNPEVTPPPSWIRLLRGASPVFDPPLRRTLLPFKEQSKICFVFNLGKCFDRFRRRIVSLWNQFCIA